MTTLRAGIHRIEIRLERKTPVLYGVRLDNCDFSFASDPWKVVAQAVHLAKAFGAPVRRER